MRRHNANKYIITWGLTFRQEGRGDGLFFLSFFDYLPPSKKII